MVNPNDVVLGGWDISKMNLGDAMRRAAVLDLNLQEKLRAEMAQMVPRPAPFDKNFVAANQESRANNVIPGTQQDQLRADLREFQAVNKVDKVVVLWTANTERYA